MAARFYVQDLSKGKTGPFDLQTVIFNIRSKRLKGSHKIWTEGMKTYKPIKDISALACYLDEKPSKVEEFIEDNKDNLGLGAMIFVMACMFIVPIYLFFRSGSKAEESFQEIPPVAELTTPPNKPLPNDELEIAAFSWVVNASVEYFAVIPYKVTVKYDSQPELNKTKFKVCVVGNYSNKNATLEKFMNVYTGIMKDEVNENFEIVVQTEKDNVYKIVAINNSEIFNYRKLIRMIEEEAKNLIVGDDYTIPVNLKMTIQNNISPEVRNLFKVFATDRRDKFKINA